MVHRYMLMSSSWGDCKDRANRIGDVHLARMVTPCCYRSVTNGGLAFSLTLIIKVDIVFGAAVAMDDFSVRGKCRGKTGLMHPTVHPFGMA